MTTIHIAAIIFTLVFVVMFTRVTVTGRAVTGIAVRFPAWIAIAMCVAVLVLR